jgi:hypothetical protein
MRTIPTIPLAIAFTAGVTFISPTALASMIGVNFVDTGDDGVRNGLVDSLGTTESAGAPGYVQSNWNNLGRWGAVTLNDTLGVSPVSTGWDATGAWGTGPGGSATGANPDDKLMSGYIDSNGGANSAAPLTGVFGDNNSKPLIHLTGMSNWLTSQGASTFSLVLYVDGDGADGRVGEYWLQSVTGGNNSFVINGDLTPHIFNNDIANFGGTYDQVSSSSTSAIGADSGNYIVFSGLTADTLLIRTEEAGGPTPRAPINGFQLVPTIVPEPSTFGLLGLTSAGVLILRRRRS